MRILYITAGAAGTICGNCLKDNALAAALKRQGHDVVLLPAYTPLLTDEGDESDQRVVFSGINLFLQGKFALFRATGLLDRLLDSPRLLRWSSSFAVDTDPANLGAMTRDMFKGEAGPYRREMAKLVGVVSSLQPDVIHLTNSMLASMAAPVRRALGVPVVCSLQGEGDFLDALPEPHRRACLDLLSRHASHIDRFIAPCADQVHAMAELLQGAFGRVSTVFPGISLDGFREEPGQRSGRFVVGFLARIAPNKGLEVLARAVEHLRAAHPREQIELRVAGWRARKTQPYIDRLRERFGFEDWGYLSRAEKVRFLGSLDAFSVPTAYRASKGLYVLEALARGVPVVQPDLGVFPELLAATGGGLLSRPGDSRDLAARLAELLTDRAEARRRADEGRRSVLREFHSDRMASETVEVYRQLGAQG